MDILQQLGNNEDGAPSPGDFGVSYVHIFQPCACGQLKDIPIASLNGWRMPPFLFLNCSIGFLLSFNQL